MPTQKRKHDDFRRAANKPGQRKISFNTRSRHLEFCSAPSEQVKNLSTTLLEDNDTTNDQNAEMQTLSQSERVTLEKQKHYHQRKQIRRYLSQQLTNLH